VSAERRGDHADPFDALSVPLEPGVTLVEASAGTGKTFAITRLVLRLLLDRRVESLSHILVVTFTEKATQELVTRIRTTLRDAERVWGPNPPKPGPHNADLFTLRETHGVQGGEIIRDALAALDDLAVSTIHGFCQRMLSESALESRIPFRTTFIEDDAEPFGRAARDWGRRRLLFNQEDAQRVVADGARFGEWVKHLVAPYRRHANTFIALDIDSPEQRLLRDFVETVHGSFELEKARRHLLGFDDLLVKLSQVLEAEGPAGPLARRIRSRFGAALIDEFQDTDRTQFPIFSNAFHGCPLFLIGDPKQSIYRFRGADINAYLRAAAQSERRYTLLTNYRSSAAYVHAVERLFTRAPDPFLVPESEIGFPRVGAAQQDPVAPGGLATDGRAAMEWWWVDGSLGKRGNTVAKDAALKYLVRAVTREVVRLRGEGLPYGRMAVLLRSNSEAAQVKRALDRARVPAVIAGDADVLESEEAGELVRLAAAIAAPHDARAVRSAMATRVWGCQASVIAESLGAGGEPAWMALTNRLAAAREEWRVRGVAAAFGELLAERAGLERLLALPDGERRLTNVRHVLELFHEAWASEGVSPEEFHAWVARERTVANTPDRRELRLETDSEAVQVMTIHKAKGLEFDVVFCPALWQAYKERETALGVHSSHVLEEGRAVLDLGSAQRGWRRMAQAREEGAEMLRLAYVALTRAVHRCYVGWGQIGSGESSAAKSPLGYLLRDWGDEVELDDDGVEGEGGPIVRATLNALVAGSGGVMAVRDVGEGEDGGRIAVGHDGEAGAVDGDLPDARPLRLAARQLDTWRLSSFTALVGDAHGEDASGAERDVADPLLAPVEVSERPVVTGFRAFPAGRVGGNALHDVFESLDFRRSDDDRSREMVRRTLTRHGLLDDAGTAEARVGDVVEMLRTVCLSPVPGTGFALADVAPRSGLREWRFDLSVTTTSPRRIAEVLAAHGSAHARAYAPVLRTLRESVVGGYLSGVVDLAFEHDAKWWLVDWKSNHLGDTDQDYASDALANAMMQAHYTLQYHLYLLALHRHLSARQPGYDPALHWGGVVYVFLRGVTGQGEGGWFRDAPTPALLEALDSALGRRR